MGKSLMLKKNQEREQSFHFELEKKGMADNSCFVGTHISCPYSFIHSLINKIFTEQLQCSKLIQGTRATLCTDLTLMDHALSCENWGMVLSMVFQ